MKNKRHNHLQEALNHFLRITFLSSGNVPKFSIEYAIEYVKDFYGYNGSYTKNDRMVIAADLHAMASIPGYLYSCTGIDMNQPDWLEKALVENNVKSLGVPFGN